MLDPKLLSLMVCPLCHNSLVPLEANAESIGSPELVCLADALAFPVRDGVPVMLPEEARSLSLKEVELLR